MGRDEDIEEQWRLLRSHWATLAAVQNQIAQQGEAYALPGQLATRREARAAIARIKAALRGWGATVEDHPDDLPPTHRAPADYEPGPATSFNQPNWQVQGQVINAIGPVYPSPKQGLSRHTCNNRK